MVLNNHKCGSGTVSMTTFVFAPCMQILPLLKSKNSRIEKLDDALHSLKKVLRKVRSLQSSLILVQIKAASHNMQCQLPYFHVYVLKQIWYA